MKKLLKFMQSLLSFILVIASIPLIILALVGVLPLLLILILLYAISPDISLKQLMKAQKILYYGKQSK
jgi:hypothetical protein